MLLLKLYLTPCKNFLLLCFLIRRLLILFSVPLALALIGFLIILGLGWHRTWGFGEQLDWDIKVMTLNVETANTKAYHFSSLTASLLFIFFLFVQNYYSKIKAAYLYFVSF